MKTVGVTLPIPFVLSSSRGLKTACFRACLHQAEEAHVYEARGERLLGVRNTTCTVKGAVGFAEMKGLKDVLIATAGELNDFRAAMSPLRSNISTHLLPIYPRDEVGTSAGVNAVLDAVSDSCSLTCGSEAEREGRNLEKGNGDGTPSSPACQSNPKGESGTLWRERDSGARPRVPCWRSVPIIDTSLVRRVFTDLESMAGEGAFRSTEWRRYLLNMVNGCEAELPREDGEGEKRARVALLGRLSGLADLPAAIERYGGRVVYDEWLQLAARLVLSDRPYFDLAYSPLVLGLRERTRVLTSRLARVDALILVVEPFSACALEETWFRGETRKPLLVLESETLGNLDATKVARLENFAAAVFSHRGAEGKRR